MIAIIDIVCNVKALKTRRHDPLTKADYRPRKYAQEKWLDDLAFSPRSFAGERYAQVWNLFSTTGTCKPHIFVLVEPARAIVDYYADKAAALNRIAHYVKIFDHANAIPVDYAVVTLKAVYPGTEDVK